MIGSRTDQMILMYTILHAIIPYCNPANFGCIPVSFYDQQIAAPQPYSVNLPFSDTDAFNFVENKLISEHIRHSQIWSFQRINGSLPCDLQTSLNFTDISQLPPLPFHRVFDRIAEHLDEKRPDEFAEAVLRFGTQTFNACRLVQDADNAPLIVERREMYRMREISLGFKISDTRCMFLVLLSPSVQIQTTEAPEQILRMDDIIVRP